ncbi:hypothetical protein [Planobispora rosea]
MPDALGILESVEVA